ncbi:hypothetical protein E2C01_069923 [Portunus trituberculatus]|uniref:Uncharacterized protein n=1 Tax=Portunus trituberculatus TaxID=210409 RepID=A0A5B7HZV5_PORTR|nr:hypothetical protein [Portunus trituberculatus]
MIHVGPRLCAHQHDAPRPCASRWKLKPEPRHLSPEGCPRTPGQGTGVGGVARERTGGEKRRREGEDNSVEDR